MGRKRQIRPWLHPDGIERAYARLLRGWVDDFTKEVETTFNRLQLLKGDALTRQDGWSEDLAVVILQLLAKGEGTAGPIIARLPSIYALVNQFNDKQWRLVVKAGTGIDLPVGNGVSGVGERSSDPKLILQKFGLGVDVYRQEPWLAARQANWVAQNTSLIKSIPVQHMQRVESIVRTAVMGGQSPRSLAADIRDASGITKKRATLIARDQIGKANGELTQERQKGLGVKEYTWETSNDIRVRDSHKDRNGKIFNWDKPPAGGMHPGLEIQCRCRASPRFEDDDIFD